MDDDVARNPKIYAERIMLQFLGCVLCSFLGFSIAEGQVQKFSVDNSGPVDGLVQRIQAQSDVKPRRDPFRPIKKLRPVSSSSRESHPGSPSIAPIQTAKNPNWKLLGIIHGQYGRQAVIQVSPKERALVRTGLEVVGSGWIIKTIRKGQVRLENSSTLPSGKGLADPRAFILSFGPLGKSS